ncbi:MAG: lipopolysaccharide biosynthesis protein [Phycisphaerae bacterium]
MQDIKGRSVRGGAVTLAGQAGKLLLQMAGLMVLARLIAPTEHGLYHMALPVLGFVLLFKDAGLAMATVQADEITHEQVSTLFWINVALSLILLALMAGLAPGVAWFYGQPELSWVTMALAGTLIFGGLTAQHQALMRRQMRFSALAAAELIAMATSTTMAVGLAFYLRNYWALVVQPVVQAATNMLLVWLLCDWRPGLPRRGCGVREMLSFGANLTGFSFVNYFSRNADNVLIGWWWGAGPLGLYAKAYSLLLLPMRQINAPVSSVVVPTLSRLQKEPQRYRNFYCSAITGLAAAGMPLCVFAFVAADPLVRVFLGEQWTDAAVLFQALAPAAFVWTLNVANGWLLVSLGQTDRQFRYGTVLAICLVLAFFIGLPWGPFGVAVSYSVVTVASRWPSWIYCFRHTPVQIRDLLRATWRPAGASLLAGAGAAAFLFLVARPWASPVQLITLLLVYGGGYVASWLALPGGWKAAHSIISVVQHAMPQPEKAELRTTTS